MERSVLFDGECNFCNGAVNFIIAHDPHKKFRFAPLQSETGMELKNKYDIPDDVDSIILVENDRAYMHSSAGLLIARQIGFPWSLCYALIIIPTPVRDAAYKLFAKYRYKLFGRREACMMPTADIRSRFL